ncbi:MAG: branched-chain amino acid ABC transporter permease [Acidimicrobiales bacterium]|nr:MAG: branched-chain amino acid ABC transporter permease [Acidimicrobiales bacterium]
MTQFLQACFDGLALGSQYALIVMGFVVIYRATGIINFAQGGALILGAYMTYNVSNTWGWNFYLAIVVSAVVVAIFSILLQRAMLQRIFRETIGVIGGLLLWAASVYNGASHAVGVVVGVVAGLVIWQLAARIEARVGARGPSELPLFGAIMVTIGVLFVVRQIVATIWGFGELNVEDPWELDTTMVGDVILQNAKIATIVLAALGLGLFFIIDRYTRIGIAMRATHFDHEAAIAQGISTKLVFATAFGLAGVVAALAGTSAASGANLITPQIDTIVFLAFPAMILGGFDSPGGAVAGGMLVGIFQNLVKTYVAQPPGWFPTDDLTWLGAGFERVAIFVVMILVLLVRPYGLFGTEEVRRV